MNNRTKNAVYSLVLVIVVATVWWFRNNNITDNAVKYRTISGEAQGTTYSIKYQDPQDRNFKTAVDSILKTIDLSLSTYIPNSAISKFNNAGSIQINDPYFYPVLNASERIFNMSRGAFDPTIAPLLNTWDFKSQNISFPDSAKIDSIQSFVGFDKIDFSKDSIIKNDPRQQLNFNAIAQGYSIDVIYNYFSKQGISNKMIELGGEMRVSGVNDQGDLWSIGIDNPTDDPLRSGRAAIVKLDNKSISSSGNYRNYFEYKGERYGHTIDPRTGYPVQKDIVSASVISEECMIADGLSTTFMVIGLEESKEILSNNPDLAAVLIYVNEEGKQEIFVTENIKKNVIL